MVPPGAYPIARASTWAKCDIVATVAARGLYGVPAPRLRPRRAWKTYPRGRPAPEQGEGKSSGTVDGPVSDGGALPFRGGAASVARRAPDGLTAVSFLVGQWTSLKLAGKVGLSPRNIHSFAHRGVDRAFKHRCGSGRIK